MIRVRDIATARAGDKGDISSIAVVALDPADYPRLSAGLTADAVARTFRGIASGPVTRHEVPEHGVLIFVLERALGGGVSRSLAFDPHGKSLSSLLLGMEIG